MDYGVVMVRWRAKEGEEPGSSKDREVPGKKAGAGVGNEGPAQREGSRESEDKINETGCKALLEAALQLACTELSVERNLLRKALFDRRVSSPSKRTPEPLGVP